MCGPNSLLASINLSPRMQKLGALFATLLAFAAAAVPARAALSPEYYGVNLQPLMKDPAITVDRWGSFLTQLQQGRMGVSRIDINWINVEPTAPTLAGGHTYHWNNAPGTKQSVDFLMAQTAMYGIRAVPTFTASPGWAQESAGNRLAASHYGDFADWVAAFAKRYGDGGAFWAENPGLPYRPVHDFEIWNEANSGNFWTGASNPPLYADLMKVVYPRLHAGDVPPLRVLLSIGWPDVATYLTAYWAAGGGPYTDGIAFHPYAPTAPDIIKLTADLRALLGNLGRPTLPILITESGQPATYNGVGVAHAYAGGVSDSARAATQVLGADAMGQSDCDIEQFLVYAVTGAEGGLSDFANHTESLMGLLNYVDATPNATGGAFLTASRRWAANAAADPNQSKGRLALCSAGTTPPAALLPLNLSLKRTGNTCVVGTVGYDTHPLEAATLNMTTSDGRRGHNNTDAFGHAEACIPNGPEVNTVDVIANIPKVARSTTFRCSIPIAADSDCEDVGVGAGAGALAKKCTWAVKLKAYTPKKLKRGTRSKITTKATLSCLSVKPKVKYKFTIALRKKGKKSEKTIGHVTLKNLRKVSFSVKVKVKKGDRLILKRNASKGVPKIKSTYALKKPKR
jgi:hypothetical protein